MFAKHTCGCVYLRHQALAFLVTPCDSDDGRHVMTRGLRKGELSSLAPLSDDQASALLGELGGLIADGYAMRDISLTLRMVEGRANRRRGEA